jgi:prepilin signal peptidase PulO-like enzyme (type II secretory pathway)
MTDVLGILAGSLIGSFLVVGICRLATGEWYWPAFVVGMISGLLTGAASMVFA